MEQLRIKCPNLTCRKILAVPVSSRGKNVRCKNCGATIRVPVQAAAPAPAPKKREGGDEAATKAA
jgi:hypothetical protein